MLIWLCCNNPTGFKQRRGCSGALSKVEYRVAACMPGPIIDQLFVDAVPSQMYLDHHVLPRCPGYLFGVGLSLVVVSYPVEFRVPVHVVQEVGEPFPNGLC